MAKMSATGFSFECIAAVQTTPPAKSKLQLEAINITLKITVTVPPDH